MNVSLDFLSAVQHLFKNQSKCVFSVRPESNITTLYSNFYFDSSEPLPL